MAKTINELKSAAAVVRDATEDRENTALRIGQLFLDAIETLGEVNTNAIKGFVVISSTDDLPTNPTSEQQQKGYLLGTVLYVYVGTGGDTLDGKYKSADIKGPQGDPGADGHDGVSLGEVALVNNLTEGGEEAALTAEQGKILLQYIRAIFSVLGNYAFPDGKPDIDFPSDALAVTLNLTNVTSSNAASSVNYGSAYTTTLTGTQSGNLYVLDVQVMMGGEDITSTAYSNGVITIADVTGALEITASQITYISDGLIFNLDGKNQGGVSGQWKDLIGNKIFDISNATSQSNGVLFSKTNSTYGTNQDNLVPTDSHLTYTIEGAFKVLNSSTWSSSFQPLSTKEGIALMWDAGYHYMIARTAGTAAKNYQEVKYSDRIITLSLSNTRGYGNGVALTTLTTAKYATAAQNVLGNLNGTVHAIRIYNRTLTEAEMLHNQKIDNIRFNA